MTDAVHEQMSRLGHTSTLYATQNEAEMAERLAHIAPGRLTRSFFTNSGTEAIETAIQLACVHTGRSEVLSLRMGYHGRSAMATGLTGHAAWRPLPGAISGITHVRAPYPYRWSLQAALRRELQRGVGEGSGGSHPHLHDPGSPPRSSRRRSRG